MPNLINLIDLDVYGRNSSGGKAQVHYNDQAISNAIVFYLTTNKGDFLYEPGKGSIFKEILFKNMDDSRIAMEETRIREEIEREFGDVVQDTDVSITLDSETKTLEVDFYWKSRETGEENAGIFNVALPENVNTELKIENTGRKIPVPYTGDNLVAWVSLNVDSPSMQNQSLLYDNRTDKWTYGNFELTNLSSTSPEFDEIITIINAE